VNEIQPFIFPSTGQQVRTVVMDDEPRFVAADVCTVLEVGNPSQAVSYLDDDEKQQVSPNLISNEGGREPWIVSEPGLYSLILRSRKPQAKAFRRWVTHEVLPSIHRTGSYSVGGASAPMSVNVTVVNALAEIAYREHVLPFAGRALAFQRWRKPRKGMQAFVQLTINLGLPGLDGETTGAKALPATGAPDA
jgi:prophage antirepressor-like protein